MTRRGLEDWQDGPEDEPESDNEGYEPLDLVEIHESDLSPDFLAED